MATSILTLLTAVPADSLRGWLLHTPLRLTPARRAVPILSGPLRRVRWIARSGTQGCWLGSYERPTAEALAAAAGAGAVVYDIGASAGCFTLLGARLVAREGLVVASARGTTSPRSSAVA